MKNRLVKIIGGGLAGSETAWQLSSYGIDVELYEMRPSKMTPVHKTAYLSELVCSNSFKSIEPTNAHGLLKKELELLGSFILSTAKKCLLPGGKALVVDRHKFSQYITESLEEKPKVKIIRRECVDLTNTMTIIASGPMTSAELLKVLQKSIGCQYLNFTDAIAPIISIKGIDVSKCFYGSRYQSGKDYLNCPMDKDQYLHFADALVNAEIVLSSGDESVFFQGCMPVEEIARRGVDSIRYGLMKPKGLVDPMTGEEAYAICQLRREDHEGEKWNMVGFQTRLLHAEQRRVFSKIPGLENINILRYGQAHNNFYVNSPEILEEDSLFIRDREIAIAGQLTGVEGYIESTAMGFLAALFVIGRIEGINITPPPAETMLGGLFEHLHRSSKDFQPHASAFDLVPPLDERIRSKRERKKKYAERAINKLIEWKEGWEFRQ